MDEQIGFLKLGRWIAEYNCLNLPQTMAYANGNTIPSPTKPKAGK